MKLNTFQLKFNSKHTGENSTYNFENRNYIFNAQGNYQGDEPLNRLANRLSIDQRYAERIHPDPEHTGHALYSAVVASIVGNSAGVGSTSFWGGPDSPCKERCATMNAYLRNLFV